jgi:hypothetical protein
MCISLGDVSLWFDVSGPSIVPQGDTTAERSDLASPAVRNFVSQI